MFNKKNLISMAVMLVLLGATLWIIFHDQDPAALKSALGAAHPLWLLGGVGCMVLYLGCDALCSKLTLGTMGYRLPYRHCYGFALAGFYFSVITPSASGGQPAQVFYMSRRGVPAACGTLAMLLFTVSYQTSLVLLAFTALILAPGMAGAMGTGFTLLLVYGTVVSTVLVVAFLLLMFRPGPAERIANWVLKLGARVRLVKDMDKSQKKLAGQMAQYRQGADHIKHTPWLFPALLAITFLQITLQYLVPWTVYMAMGLSGSSAVRIVAAQALLSLAVNCLPIPGAAGAAEAGFLSVFRDIFTPGLVSAAMLLSRSISFYLPMILTGIATLILHFATRSKRT